MASMWPPSSIQNELSIATLSLGSFKHHTLPDRLRAAAAAGFTVIDLFDEDWAAHLQANGQNPDVPWEASAKNLAIARDLGTLVKSLGMRIACTQPLRNIEGQKDAMKRRQILNLVAQRFPFMRAFETDLVFLCANVDTGSDVTSDYKTVASDLAELGCMAEEYALQDGGPMIRIGYEGLSWAQRNTWASSWEVVRAANRHNVGLILDSFNLLAVEFANPYHPEGHGRIYSTLDESLDVLRMSLASLVATVPGDRIFFYQLADAELVDANTCSLPSDLKIPALLPWSRSHRLFPAERHLGGYMPVDMVTAAVLATGYQGPLSLEVFNASLNQSDPCVPTTHADRGYRGLTQHLHEVQTVAKFWGTPMQATEAYQMWRKGKSSR